MSHPGHVSQAARLERTLVGVLDEHLAAHIEPVEDKAVLEAARQEALFPVDSLLMPLARDRLADVLLSEIRGGEIPVAGQSIDPPPSPSP